MRAGFASVLLLVVLSPGAVAQAQEPVKSKAPGTADSTAVVASEGVASDSGVVLDFQEADIRVVIDALAEAGRLNVVHSGLPNRAVTLRTHEKVPRSEVIGLLRTLVESNGLVMSETRGLVKIAAAPSPAPTPAQQGASVLGSTELNLYVYPLKHARAFRMAATVQSLFGGYGGGYGGGYDGYGTGYGGYGAQAIGGDLGRTSLSQDLRRAQIPQGYFPGAVQQPQLPTGAQMTGTGVVQGAIQVVPDDLTNSLLVRASPGDWEVIRQALGALDVRPLQVLIEVLIAEVRRNRDFNVGVSAEIPEQEDEETGIRIAGTAGSESVGDVALRILNIGPISADVAVSALSSRADVTILSRPVILAQNNYEARILVGSERPFVQVMRALPTENAVRDQVVQYREVGTSLSILPTINADGYVSLQLLQEVSSATNETQFGAPVISTREASTQLLVKDGQTAVIGGLIDRQQDLTRTGIPLLKDLPLLGWLFGSTQRARYQTEMFLFLTPHVIRTDEEAERLKMEMEGATELLQERLRGNETVVPPDSMKREGQGEKR